MGVFDVSGENPELGADWFLFRDGPVHLVHGDDGRDELVAELSALGYRIGRVDCSGDATEVVTAIYGWLGHERRPGQVVLDALKDRLFDYGVDGPEDAGSVVSGSVLVLELFDRFAERDVATAYGIADLFADVARTAMLVGHRMLLVLHVDDWSFVIPPVGATAVSFMNWPRHVVTPDSDSIDHRRWYEQVEAGRPRWRRLFGRS